MAMIKEVKPMGYRSQQNTMEQVINLAVSGLLTFPKVILAEQNKLHLTILVVYIFIYIIVSPAAVISPTEMIKRFILSHLTRELS